MAEAKALTINTGLSILASTTLFTLSNLSLFGVKQSKISNSCKIASFTCELSWSLLCSYCFVFLLCSYSPMAHRVLFLSLSMHSRQNLTTNTMYIKLMFPWALHGSSNLYQCALTISH